MVFRESYMLFDKKRPVRIQGDYLSSLPTVTNGKGWVALTFDFDHRPFPDALFPVSYTHLDVYKRQV